LLTDKHQDKGKTHHLNLPLIMNKKKQALCFTFRDKESHQLMKLCFNIMDFAEETICLIVKNLNECFSIATNNYLRA
jgi:hypothetical protein